jgi:hypothetical protein
MTRFLAAAFLTSVVAVALGACGDDNSADYAYGYGYSGGGGGTASICSQYTTCGSCTPVDGCGWCFTNAGGTCTTDPDECLFDATEFTWTWDSTGCPGADASVVPLDAGTPSHEASVPSPEAAPEAAPPEAAADALPEGAAGD